MAKKADLRQAETDAEQVTATEQQESAEAPAANTIEHSVSAKTSAEAELLDKLAQCFTPNQVTPFQKRRQFMTALYFLGRYVGRTLGDRSSEKELFDLTSALRDSEDGKTRDFLRRDGSVGRAKDPTNVWYLRARVCHAFRLLVKSGMTLDEAATHIFRKYRKKLRRIAGGKELKKSTVRNWYDQFDQYRVKNSDAQRAHNEHDKLLKSLTMGKTRANSRHQPLPS